MRTDTGTTTSAPNRNHGTSITPRKPIRGKQPKTRHNHPISYVSAHVYSFCFRNNNQPPQKHGKNQNSHFHTLGHPNSTQQAGKAEKPKTLQNSRKQAQASRPADKQQADNTKQTRQQPAKNTNKNTTQPAKQPQQEHNQQTKQETQQASRQADRKKHMTSMRKENTNNPRRGTQGQACVQ